MKHSATLLFAMLSSVTWSQTLNEAQEQFDNFDYRAAFETYLALNKTEDLSAEDQMQLVYSGYVVGEFDKAYEPSKEVVLETNVAPFFYFIHGEISMHNGDYEAAKAAYQKYSQMDDEMDVSVKIQSCDQLPNWKPIKFEEYGQLLGNTTHADITGYHSPFGTIRIHEIMAKTDETDDSALKIEGLMLSRPYLEDANGNVVEIEVPTELHLASIQSFIFLPSSNQALFTVTEPVSSDNVKKAPHIYSGNWDASQHSISNVTPWQFSGFEDSSFCAHATVDASEQRIIFSKVKSGGNSDLFMTKLEDGSWSLPTPLTDLNTPYEEMFPVFQGDSVLTFACDGRPGYGNLDVYTYDFDKKEITHLKAPINSNMDDFNFLYSKDGLGAVYTSNRSEGTGDDDRYKIVFALPPVPVEEAKPDSTDFYQFVSNWNNQTVYFAFDKYNLEEDVKILDDMISFLGKYPQSKIYLDGHSDRRGENLYNYRLSEKRATAVLEGLVEKGISKDQIVAKPQGELNPVLDCDTCTEKMHQENRVVIIKLEAK